MRIQTKGRLTVNIIKGRTDVYKGIHDNNVLDDLFHGYNGIHEEEVLINQYHIDYFGGLARKK